MPLQFYKANQSVKGCACGLSFNSKDESFFISLIKQTGWDAKSGNGKGNGIFKNGPSTNVKFSAKEVAGLIRAIEENKEYKGFHTFGGKETSFRLAPYMAKDSEGNEYQRGFGLSVTKKEGDAKETFLMPFDMEEAALVREYLKFVLGHIFSAIYSADKQSAKNNAEKKGGKTPSETQETDTEEPAW